MVEFRFDIKPLFPEPIIKITSRLLPPDFRGDRRECLESTSKISEIINKFGELSAVSQRLTNPVTTASRLRLAETQSVYLMADVEAGKNGEVIGMLKIGSKDLYLYDEAGTTQCVNNVSCILDFYIHESRQRAGLGKKLYDTMLAAENWTAVKCSIDRPSDKLLAFLRKHYQLVKTIPQSNNFVLFRGFFSAENGGRHTPPGRNENKHRTPSTNGGMHITNSPNTQLFGATFIGDGEVNRRRQRHMDPNGNQQPVTQLSPVGRYGARRPTCSMAEIIHSGAAPRQGSAEANSIQATQDEIDAIAAALRSLEVGDELPPPPPPPSEPEPEPELPNETFVGSEEAELPEMSATPSIAGTVDTQLGEGGGIVGGNRKPAIFTLSKQHTGMKNISFGVGMAVTPSSKMEFDQETREDFGVVKINRPIGKATSPPDGDAASAVSSTGGGLTDQGYYDLKFYHNKLW